LANEQDGSSYIKLYTLKNNGGNLSGYTRLGVSAEFQSLLNNTDTISGNYGLKFYIYSSLPSAPGEGDKDGIYELYLDTSAEISEMVDALRLKLLAENKKVNAEMEK
jgi:hypothetical protein